jgi:hypothetical protein
MQGRARITEIVLLALGLILGCCWLPRGINGLMSLLRVVGPTIRLPSVIAQFMPIWYDPLGWYASRIVPRFGGRLGAFLLAVPNCLCGIVAIAIIAAVIFLFVRARSASGREAA